MGIRGSSSIKIIKQARSSASMVAPPLPVRLTRQEMLQQHVDAFNPLDFDLRLNQTNRGFLERYLKKIFENVGLFPKKELEGGLMLAFKTNPNVSKWNAPETWTGLVEFEVYPKGKKKEGIVRGSFSHRPEMARKYPKHFHYHLDKLTLDTEKASKAPRAVKKLTSTEEKGWKKLLNPSNGEIDLTEALLGTYNSGGDIRRKTIAKLAADYLGTDGSELQHLGSLKRRYRALPVPPGQKYGGYAYDWEFEVYRSYHRSDLAVHISIEDRNDYTGGNTGHVYTLKSIRKI
jgi:hypothetical protein